METRLEGRIVKSNARAGHYVKQLEGYRAFEPAGLPPEPPIAFDGDLVARLSAADTAVGRLDGLARTLPDADLFLAMYVRQEALLSSRIEGTECTMDDVLAFELLPAGEVSLDVGEVVNYVAALHHGVARLDELPLCNRLLREVHAVLLRSGRGADKSPGEFRQTQNWIGPGGCTLATASFVPPAPDVMSTAMSALEKFVNVAPLPVLMTAGLAHAQFETIHPFLDGNGRTGRLLISLLLHERGVLTKPVLYLSTFLKRHQAAYFDRLAAVRSDGDWEGWLGFFLDGVSRSARSAAATAEAIHRLREADRARIVAAGGVGYDMALLDGLYRQPLVNSAWVEKQLGVTTTTANKVLGRLRTTKILRETTGNTRNRLYRYDAYVDLFEATDAVEHDNTHS
jgi:cell filamentation protein, protein adenylyltransferase